jgi:hypothetical protein
MQMKTTCCCHSINGQEVNPETHGSQLKLGKGIPWALMSLVVSVFVLIHSAAAAISHPLVMPVFATAAQLVGDTSSTSLAYGGDVLAVILTLTPRTGQAQ